jgi:hypothetical protein
MELGLAASYSKTYLQHTNMGQFMVPFDLVVFIPEFTTDGAAVSGQTFPADLIDPLWVIELTSAGPLTISKDLGLWSVLYLSLSLGLYTI